MGRTARGAPRKLTQAQRDDIFDAYAGLRTREERERFERETAERCGVSAETIRRITHDGHRLQKRKKEAEQLQELAWICLAEHALNAVMTQVEMMGRNGTTDQQLRMRQSAATDIMNRLGMSREREEPRDVQILITGLEVGMPRESGEEEEHKEESGTHGSDAEDPV